MALVLGNKLLDAGLGYVSSNADRIYICSAEPTTYTQATSTYALGYDDFGVGGVAGAPQAATGGRKVVTNPVSGGLVTVGGTPVAWAIVDTVNSLLLATGPMSGAVAITTSDAWSLGAIGLVQTGALTGYVFDAATTAWAAAVVTAGGTVSGARKILVDQVVVGLKADGVWAKIDRLWLFTNENRESAYTDLVVQGFCTPAPGYNPASFTADQAVNPFQRGNTEVAVNYIPSTQAVNFSQNSAHIACWQINDQPGSNDANLGIWGSGTAIYAKQTATNTYYLVNSASAFDVTLPNGSCAGLQLVNRSASNALQAYMNDSSIGTSAIASAAVLTATLNLDYGHIGAVSIGGSLTSTEQAALYNRLLTYLQAVYGVTNIETMGWIRMVTVFGGTASTGRKSLIDNLITGLKTDGVFYKLDRLWIYAAENAVQARIDLCHNNWDHAVVNAPAFTTDRGYLTSSTAYINTGSAIPATGTQASTNSLHIADWIETAATTNSSALIGNLGTKNTFLWTGSSGNYGFLINDNLGTALDSTTPKTTTGLLLGSRTASNAVALYMNGVSIASGSNASATPDANINFVGGRNNFGTMDIPAAHRSAASAIGAGLDATEQLALYNRLRTYMTAVGVA